VDLTWRPLTIADATELALLYAAAEEVDRTGEHFGADDLAEVLTEPNVDLPRATIAAHAGDRMVAYGIVHRRDQANPVHLVYLESIVHPEYRDDAVAAHLTEWFVKTGREVHAWSFPDAPLELRHDAHQNQHWIAGVLARAGYSHRRTIATMRVSLTDLPTQPPLPAGVEPVAFVPEHDLATLDARNDTFAGHWGATAFTFEAWRHKVTGSKTFRPELSFVVMSPDGEVQAFVLSHVFAADEAATGVREQYVGWIGTRKAQRGKGIASGLLGHALQVGRAAGYERALLNVDFDNATGALGVYERCGFRIADEWHSYIEPA
jgi:mycothiol synthase